PHQIQRLVVFGDSYSVQNVGDGRVQWADWAASRDYANVELLDFAQSGATCSQALTPRVFPAVLEDEVPVFEEGVRNGSVPRLVEGKEREKEREKTVFAVWIGTNDVGAGCLLTGGQTPGVTLVDTTRCVAELIERIYALGGRNFLFLNVRFMVPLERAPMYQVDAYPTRYWMAAKNATEFNVVMKELTTAGNALHNFMLADLKKSLPGANIGIFDSHTLLNNIMDNPAQFLNGTAPFNVTGSANPCPFPVDGTQPIFCTLVNSTDQDSYVWYNELHLSNQANRIVARNVAQVIRGKENQFTKWL
ncbi:GDSL lipase/acylhydrolase, partial [Cristinia sonorae]